MQGKQREVYEKMKIDNDYGAIDINGIMASDIVFPFSKTREEAEEKNSYKLYFRR